MSCLDCYRFPINLCFPRRFFDIQRWKLIRTKTGANKFTCLFPIFVFSISTMIFEAQKLCLKTIEVVEVGNFAFVIKSLWIYDVQNFRGLIKRAKKCLHTLSRDSLQNSRWVKYKSRHDTFYSLSNHPYNDMGIFTEKIPGISQKIYSYWIFLLSQFFSSPF